MAYAVLCLLATTGEALWELMYMLIYQTGKEGSKY